MAKNKTGQSLGPIRRALFQKVPNIIDRIWHWSEYLTIRLGVVSFESPWVYQQRPVWRTPAFTLFIVISAFLTFGPTADSLCLAVGPEHMVWLRHLIAIFSGLMILYLFLRISNRAAQNLALDAEASADRICERDADLAKRRANADAVRIKFATGTSDSSVFSRLQKKLLTNFARLMAACTVLSGRDITAFFLAVSLLMLGSIVVLLPLGSIFLTSAIPSATLPTCTKGPIAPLVWQCASLALCIAFTAWGWKRSTASWKQFLIASVLWCVLIGVLWGLVAMKGATEAQGGPYPHVYALIVAALLIAAGIAYLIAWWVFSNPPARMKADFRKALASTDLISYQRENPDVGGFRLLSALINGVAIYFRHWILLPALAVFVAPGFLVNAFALIFVGVSSILITYGNLSSRWSKMLLSIERWFLNGTVRLVSYAVIAVAVLRLWGVQYVTTIMDAAPTGVLLVIVIMAYTAIWYYDMWINRWLGESLLGLLGDKTDAQRGWIDYQLDANHGHTWASKNGRVLALHGPGIISAQGFFTKENCREGERSPEFAFTSYRYKELFDLLDNSKHRKPSRYMRRRIRFYFSVVNIILFVIFFALLAWFSSASEPMKRVAVVTAHSNVAPANLDSDLSTILVNQTISNHPVIIVAASGGGTRAAVYTAVALEGLGRLGVTQDIALLSGVSGGGVGAATFASRVERLIATKPNVNDENNPWSEYVNEMGDPFVQDVLEGVSELRLARSTPLAVLLKESLERRIYNGPVQTFGQLSNIGLILNTTITGHPYTDSELLRDRVGLSEADIDRPCVIRPYASLAGGRLIFTNQTHVSEFRPPSVSLPDMRLPYKIVNDPDVQLAAGSALTANFPPVFSNAHVKLKTGLENGCDAESYFVTDGGATENLGLVSALLAIDSAIGPALSQLRLQDHDAQLPPIHVVAIEASAISYDYADDRGIGAATGGSKERINAGLTQALIAKLDARLAQYGSKLELHYLTLPVVFRSRGGFGTHWMFANTVQVANPLLASAPGFKERMRRGFQGRPADKLSLTRPEVLMLWRALYSGEGKFCHSDSVRPTEWPQHMLRVADWICGRDQSRILPPLKPDWQVKAWDELVESLSESAHRD